MLGHMNMYTKRKLSLIWSAELGNIVGPCYKIEENICDNLVVSIKLVGHGLHVMFKVCGTFSP